MRRDLLYVQVHFQIPHTFLERRAIAWQKSVKYLRVRLDQHLNLKAHVTGTLKKGLRVQAALYRYTA